MDYITQMENVDFSFSKIKEAESINNVNEIVKELKRYEEKKVEKHSELYLLNNKIDQLNKKIEEDKIYIQSAMEMNASLIDSNLEDQEKKFEQAGKVKRTFEE